MRGLIVLMLAAGLPQCGPLKVVFGDRDHDGSHRPADCDDRDASVHPGATDVPGDGVDQDCDGSDAVVADTDPAVDTDDTDVLGDTGDVAVETGDTAVVDTVVVDTEVVDTVVVDPSDTGDTFFAPPPNHRPTVTDCTISPTVADMGTPFSVTAHATDPDGDPVTVTTTWMTRNDVPPGYQGNVGSGATLASCDERNQGLTDIFACWPLSRIWVECVADDGRGGRTSLTSDEVTIEARQPHLTVALSPAPLVADQEITAVLLFDDLDPRPWPSPIETTTYAWSVNGLLVGTAAHPGPVFHKGDTVHVDVAWVDEVYGISASGSAEGVVVDSKPRIDGCTISPATGVKMGTALTGAGTHPFDADGDVATVAYQWQLQQFPAWVNLPGQTSATLPSCLDRNVAETSPSSIYNCRRGSVIRLVCTPKSGSVAGNPVVATPVTIEDTAPVITRLDVLGASDPLHSTLIVDADAHDDDGEALTWSYAWRVDGVQVGTADRLTSASYQSGDTVEVEVLVRDAYGAWSDPATATVPVP